eukprot:14191665-Alexandrium_andersonii.AAC.1
MAAQFTVRTPQAILNALEGQFVKSVQLGKSRCVGRASMADSPRGKGRTRAQRLIGAPSEPPLHGRRQS